ncbi:hypothetical protein M5K25_003386 [Dendrobium thyrsiflorum]|uniref:Early nodulin-93-like n=1 Tax=Dendrobium thyrsiflorum TaxID=117978 RepID=A0ABD0VRN4_DENTH
MGIPSDVVGVRGSKRSSFVVAASPNEPRVIDNKTSPTQDAVQRGLKMAIIVGSVVAVPTLVGCRVIPWAKANLNHTAQALSISAAAISTFFITADKAILKNARRNTIDAVWRGLKMAIIAGSVVAVPTLVGCRVIPWAKANLNHTAQALSISAATISAFFITADKAILKNARENAIGKYDKSFGHEAAPTQR